jgi:hypothetical protein
MVIWREAENDAVMEGQVVTGQVLPPARYTARGLSLLTKSIGLLLFFILRTLRPLVRIVLGLIAGFTLFGGIISFAAAGYRNWSHKPAVGERRHVCGCARLFCSALVLRHGPFEADARGR